MEHNRHNFLSFRTVFLPFYPPMDPVNQTFEKIKNTLEDTIILHMGTIKTKSPENNTKTVPSSTTNCSVCLKKCSKIRTKMSMLQDDHPQKMTQTI